MIAGTAIVDWLSSSAQPLVGTDRRSATRSSCRGRPSSMLGFAADHLAIEWFPVGLSRSLEQGEPVDPPAAASSSGTADIVLDGAEGTGHHGAQGPHGDPGPSSARTAWSAGRPRNAHVIAR